MNKILNFFKSHKSGLIFNSIFSVLFVLPIILANVYFIDDMGRIIEGYGLNGPGRYFATIIMKIFVSLNLNYSYNIFPYSIIISAIIYGFIGYLISLELGLEKNKKYKISSLILVTSPFLLENLSYFYDSITMAISLLIVIIPFYFKHNFIKFAIVSILAVFISFGIYQVSATCFLILLILNLIKDINHIQKKHFILFAIGCLSFIIALIGYKILLIITHADLGEQASLVNFDTNILQKLKQNFLGYIGLLRYLMISGNYYLIFSVFCILSIIGLFYTSITSKNKIISILIILLAILAIFILTGGINLFVKTPKWFSRTMIGFPFLLFILFFLQKNLPNILRKTSAIVIIILIYNSFLISAQYGNFLKNDDEYFDFISNLIAPEISKNENINVTFVGKIPKTPRNILLEENFPILRKTAPLYMNGRWIWGLRRINKFGITNGNYEKKLNFQYSNCDLPLIQSNKFYDLRMNDEIAVIDFDKKACK